jgi:DNA repair protein RecO (recombination protein O)
MEFRYNAIVLKKKEVGETDRLYTLYTLQHGKVQVVAKGVRKPEAKLAGQLETLMCGLVIVVRGRGMGKVAGAVAENVFPYLRTDVDILGCTLDTVAAFDRMIGWEEPDPEMFALLQTYLFCADSLVQNGKEERIAVLSQGFLVQLFERLGYRLETEICAVSGGRLTSGGQHFFSPGSGGVLSEEHHHTDMQAFPISENAIKLIRLFLGNRLESLQRIQVDEDDAREIDRIVQRFFRWIRP